MTRGRILWATGLAAAGFVLASSLGVEPLFAAAWAILAGTVVIAASVVLPDDPSIDRPDSELPERRTGSEVSRLAWAINPRTGEAGQLVLRRVTAILRRRLLSHGIDVDDPAQRARAAELIGDDVWEALRRPRAGRADIERALDAAHRLQDHTIEETRP